MGSSPWTPDTRLSRTVHGETSQLLQEDMLIPAPLKEDESEDFRPECPELPNDKHMDVDHGRVESLLPAVDNAPDSAASGAYEDGHFASEGAASSEPLSRCSLGAQGGDGFGEIQKLHIMCQSLHEK